MSQFMGRRVEYSKGFGWISGTCVKVIDIFHVLIELDDRRKVMAEPHEVMFHIVKAEAK